MKTIFVDLDGTMFDINHRLSFLEKKDYAGFWDAIPDDKPHDWCVRLVKAMLLTGHEVIFVSGRNEIARKVTQGWLDVLGFSGCELFMRPETDYREDYIIKDEIYTNFLQHKDVLFVVDDRKQVVDMWRSKGLTVLQCAEGNF